MTSIRPLATITVLAGVFVFLYMKINETEPILPAGIEGWQIDQTVEIGGDFGGAPPQPQFAVDAPAATTAPAFAPAPPAGEAPPFNASPAESASAAPSWPAPNASGAPTAPAGTPAEFALGGTPAASSPDVSLDVPDLPPLPTLPPAAQSTSPNLPPAGNTPSLTPMTTGAPEFGNTAPTQQPTTPVDVAQTQSSLFSAARLAVQAALDRGELSQALLLLSDWYGDPSLSASEAAEVEQLLGQLAGSVIYSTQHRLEPPYMVQAGERLDDIAKKYQVPWQLLAKVNSISQPDQLQPGQQLKVIRGPFSAVVDFSQRKLTLMLNRRYAGEFHVDIDPTLSVEEGQWAVSQKLLTPGNAGLSGGQSTTPTDLRSLMLTNATDGASQIVILRGSASPTATDPVGRVIRLAPGDVEDVYDILSLGSQVVIRR